MDDLMNSEEYATAIRCLCQEWSEGRLTDEQFFPVLNVLSVSWAKAYDRERRIGNERAFKQAAMSYSVLAKEGETIAK